MSLVPLRYPQIYFASTRERLEGESPSRRSVVARGHSFYFTDCGRFGVRHLGSGGWQLFGRTPPWHAWIGDRGLGEAFSRRGEAIGTLREALEFEGAMDAAQPS